MSWKAKITGPEQTTGTQFGGITLNAVLDYFSGFDHTVGGTLPLNNVDIATETLFANNTLKLWDSNKSHKITFQTPDYTENKTWTFPDEAAMGATDQFVFKDTVQTLTGKVLNFTTSNTAQNIPKSAISAPAVFTDQDNILGAHSFDLSQYTVPGSPASGARRVHVDPVSGKLSVKRSDGIIVSLEEGTAASAGGFAAGSSITRSQTVSTNTIFTIAHGQPQIPDIVVVFPTTVDANADRTVTKDATNITITYNTPPPTGTNNLGFIWGAAYVNPDALLFNATSVTTMQNKTINVDQNTIKHSTTNTDGDLLVYTTNKYIPLARGSANYILAVNSAGTGLQWIESQSNNFLKLTKQASAPADPALEDAVIYVKALDANNNGLFLKIKQQGAIVEMRLFPQTW